MKRLSLLAAAAFAAIAVAVVLTARGSAQEPGEQTIRLVERPGSAHFVDNPPKGTRARPISAGDVSVQTMRLFDASNTRRVGTLFIECIAMRGGTFTGGTFHCTGAYKLAGGTLSFDFAGGSARTTTLAITGGTGAYEARRGSAVQQERPNSNLLDDTIHLVP